MSYHDCCDCDCTSRQIINAKGCPREQNGVIGEFSGNPLKMAGFTPAGRPLIPGQDCTPKRDPFWRYLAYAVGLVSIAAAVGLAIGA